MSLNCFYVLSILGKHSLILKEKRVFVLNFTETRDKLFFILGISEARVLKKVVLKKNKIAQGEIKIFSHFKIRGYIPFSTKSEVTS